MHTHLLRKSGHRDVHWKHCIALNKETTLKQYAVWASYCPNNVTNTSNIIKYKKSCEWNAHKLLLNIFFLMGINWLFPNNMKMGYLLRWILRKMWLTTYLDKLKSPLWFFFLILSREINICLKYRGYVFFSKKSNFPVKISEKCFHFLWTSDLANIQKKIQRIQHYKINEFI